MVIAIEKELEETKVKWQQTQGQLDKTKSELHDVREELERSQSQLDEVLGELEQTHFELHQLKEKGEPQQSESNGQVQQELAETKAKLQETEKLLKESQSQKETEEFKGKWQETQKQLDKTKSEFHDVKEELERSQSQLDEVLGELEQTHFELHQFKEKGQQHQSEANGQVKQELEETKAKLQETEQLLEESQSQLGETMGVLEEYKSQMEQTMGALEESQGKLQQKHEELEQVKGELAEKQLGVESELHKELEETKSQWRETEELLEKYQSQLEETMATLEESLSQLDSNQKELEQTKFELHQVQQTAKKTQPSGFQLTSEKLGETKSQIKLKTKTRLESTVVAGVTMFKDEQDIAYHNLVWHYNQGIQRFVVLDNMSSDNTPQEVKRFADDYPDAQVYLIEDPEVGYYQSRKMTAAAEFAHKMWGAEWILPFDADEILCSFRGLLHTVLASIPREHICIKLPYKVHLLRSFYDDSELNPFKRITHRQKGDVNKGAKIIIRWRSGMVIGQGNHNVTVDKKFLPMTNNKHLGLMFRHYPFRSKEHIRQKVINGGKAYGAAKDLPQNQGGAWKQWDNKYKIKGEEYIEEMYNSQVKEYHDAIYDPAII